ncbi:MAG: ABC transporter permease [Anaerolineae bacterium]|nr:ABC transporter permease [Anaerolineae bacterium]
MARYLIGRVLGLIGVLLVISFITFVLMKAIPGGPYDEMHMPLTGPQKENILRSFGLDKPFLEQYVRLLWNFIRFDLGYSFSNRSETVNEFFARAWPVSAQLGLMTMAVAFPIGIALGFIAALRANTWVDYFASTIALTGFVVPGFVMAFLLILVFTVHLKWLPLSGWDTPSHWVMPVIANALAPMAIAARYTRASLLENLHADYVRTAHAKGLHSRRVLFGHVARNAVIPIIAVLTPLFPILITGSVFIEQVFIIPGIGRYFALSVMHRDYPMIMATVLLLTALVGFANLVADVLYTIVDPRVRLTR